MTAIDQLTLPNAMACCDTAWRNGGYFDTIEEAKASIDRFNASGDAAALRESIRRWIRNKE